VGEALVGRLELVAEGNAVFARFDYSITLPDESERTTRGLSYYHLSGGMIDLNDVMMAPDLSDVLAPLMGSPPTNQ
jgi:hypothetical protein